MKLQFLGVSIMSQTKDLLDNPDSQTKIDALLDSIARDFQSVNIIDVTVPMNTNAEAMTARGSNFAIEPATYAARFNNKIHALGKKVYWRATDCYFEGLYSFSKATRRNGNRYTFFGDAITDDFSSSSTRSHGYSKTSAAGNLSSNYLTSHQASNDWTITNGELVGPTADGWRKTILFNANYINDVTMVAKVKKVGNQQIVVRATTDSNFPGYGLQMRDSNTLRIERPGLANLGEVTNKTWVTGNYYWLKLQAIGTSIKGKSWAVGDAEPGSWDIEITDATYTNGYCGFSGESNNGVFDDMTITPEIDTGTWMYSSCDWIRDNISLFETGDIICPFPEASAHQTLTNQGSYNQFFIDQKYCISRLGADVGKTFNTGYAAHLYTAVIQNTYESIYDDAGVATYDHYGVAIGLNKRFTSSSQGTVTGSAAYSLTNALNEGVTHKCTFIPEKVAYNTDIDVYVIDKGTGNWTMEIHDSSNNRVQMPDVHNFASKTTTGIVTIANASLTNNALNTFTISWDNPLPDESYHFHLYSSDGTGTVLVTTGTSLANCVFTQYKCNASADALEIDIRKAYAITGQPQFLGEWGDYWSTDASLSNPVRTQLQHEAYLREITGALQRLVNDGILIGFCYWRILGGQEAIMSDIDSSSGWNYQMTYAGRIWKSFFDLNRVGRIIVAKNRRTYPIGINHNFLNFTSFTQIRDTYLPPMVKAGIRWARYEMVMVDQQPTQGVFDFTGANYDARVDLIRSRGLEVIALLDFYSMPEWAKAAGGSGWNARPTAAVYGEWCRNVALHYTGKIKYFELGNEPNYTIYWPSYPNYLEYLDFLIAGYNGIKAGNPSAMVISGGLGGAINAPQDWISTAVFLDGLMAYGAANYYDILAVHPYPDSISDTDINSALNKITTWRAIQTSYGDTKPMALTEIGRSTSSGGVTDAQQAAWAASLFSALTGGSYDYVKFMCWHNFRDAESAITSDSEKHYGITYYPDTNPKPAFQSFINAKNSYNGTYRKLLSDIVPAVTRTTSVTI